MQIGRKPLRILWSNSIQFIDSVYMLGMATLSEHLHKVAEFILGDTRSYKTERWKLINEQEMKESISFVQGTGIDVVIQSYGLNVNPQQFKDTFFQWVNDQHWKKFGCSLQFATTSELTSLNGV